MKKSRKAFEHISAVWMMRAAVFIVLWLSLVSLPVQILDVSLDNSWKGVLIDAAREHRQFGSDILCTYGPLGHLLSDVYAGQPLAPQTAWELACKAVYALLILWAAGRISNLRLSILFVAAACLFSGLDPDAFYFLLIVMLGLFMMEAREHKRLYWIEAASLLALLAMTKFSFFLLSTLAVATAAWRQWLGKKPEDAAVIASSYCALLLIVWIACGQDLRHFPIFLRSSFEMTRGYAGAMGLTVAPWMLACGLAVVLSSGLALALLSWRRRGQALAWPEQLLQAAALFLAWKTSFVRPDLHVVVVFDYCLLAFFLYLPHLLDLRKARIALAAGVSAAVISLGTLHEIGRDVAWPYFVDGSPVRVARQVADNARLLLDLPGRQKVLSHALMLKAASLAMPRTLAAVGGGSIDMLGDAQGLILLNAFRYAPRPAFQSYFAYTPYLLRRNAAYFAGLSAPEFVLLKIDAIDGRLPASEDGLSLREVLARYEPVLTERTCLLMRRKGDQRKEQSAVLLASGEFRWDRKVQVPASPGGVWAEIDVRPSPIGEILGLLYRPPLVSMTASLAAGPSRWFRLVPAAAREGFLLNPVVEDSDSLMNARNPKADRRVASFTLSSDGSDWLFQPTFRATFFAAGL